jgi:hypothetical protein
VKIDREEPAASAVPLTIAQSECHWASAIPLTIDGVYRSNPTDFRVNRTTEPVLRFHALDHYLAASFPFYPAGSTTV